VLYDYFYDLMMMRVVLKMSNIETKLLTKTQIIIKMQTKQKHTLLFVQYSFAVSKTKHNFNRLSKLSAATETTFVATFAAALRTETLELY